MQVVSETAISPSTHPDAVNGASDENRGGHRLAGARKSLRPFQEVADSARDERRLLQHEVVTGVPEYHQ